MAQIKTKVKILEKKPLKKPRWWFWSFLAIVVIVGIILIVKNNYSDSTDKSLIAKIEQATAKSNEVIAEVQGGNLNFEEAKAKIAEAQKTVDEAKANAKTDEEKQAVAVAQMKINEATKAVETSNQATELLVTDNPASPSNQELSDKLSDPSNRKTSTESTTSDNSTVKSSSSFPYKIGETYNVYQFGYADDAYRQTNPELDKLVKVLMENPTIKILITAYTDKVGNAENNQALSERRAKAIFDYLVSKGIDGNRLKYEGKGISTKFPSDKENRRADFQIIE